ncbi:tail fiber chaperone [Alteromonas phage vB_AemP_PT15-A5]|nr:tail fiber chaperone [Alteromonas phage vB_AemP_PT15-A5]
MLEFINENDFLLVDTYKENEDGSVSWVYKEGEGLPTHSGVIREGFIRTTQVQTGVEQVKTGTEEVQIGEEEVVIGEDAEGNDVTETQPVYETKDTFEEQPVFKDKTIDVWAKLQELVSAGTVTVEPLDITPLIENAKQVIDAQRDAKIASGIEFEGDTYQTAPVNLTDMLEAVVADRDTQWLTEDNTVVDMPVDKLKRLISAVADLKELYIYKARQHKNNVLQLTTKEDIEQYLANLTW